MIHGVTCTRNIKEVGTPKKMVNKSKSYVRTQEGEEEFLGRDLLTFPRGKLTTLPSMYFRKPSSGF